MSSNSRDNIPQQSKKISITNNIEETDQINEATLNNYTQTNSKTHDSQESSDACDLSVDKMCALFNEKKFSKKTIFIGEE